MTARKRLAPTEGERWAAVELAALRASRYDAAAGLRFIDHSLRRAADTRRRRAPLARQADRWILGGGLALVLLRMSIVRRAGRVPSARSLACWWLIQTLMLDWHLGMVEGLDGAPREKLAVADALTLSRAAVAPFAACAPPDAVVFLALLAFAGATDLLDGRFARRVGPTRFGRDFDPLADLAFRAAALRGAHRAGWVSSAPVCAVAGRQTLLVCGSAWSWFSHAQRPPLDQARFARWDAPPLLAGLALAASGHRRSAGFLISLASAVGAAGLLRTGRACDDHEGTS